ncbi:MAG: discoidin domain-containing protein [Acidobacteriota bacterium]|nr:discoidin domain-containing protein [Acidobacteriota bacterium]
MIARAAVLRAVAVLAAYAVIAGVCTHPLLGRLTDGIANDRYDPVLNASILWWNATTLPFSSAWWTPPHYYPNVGIAAFTENLVGLSVISSPVAWASGNAVLAYNLAVFLSWPLSAFAVYLLVLRLGASGSAAFFGGLAFGFAPYRISQMAHVQVLSAYWLALALAGLHGFLSDRRRRWLLLFGIGWLLQSLTNGYFMLYGGVLIAGWLLYFCSRRETISAAVPIVTAWVVASLPLIPVMLVYRRVHAEFGLVRELPAIMQYAAEPWAWLRVSPLAAVWGSRLADGGGEWNLFPGVTVVLITLMAAASIAARSAKREPASSGRYLAARRVALVIAGLSSLVVLTAFVVGPWRVSLMGLALRVTSIDRPLVLGVSALVAYGLLGGRWIHAGERRPFAFYALGTVAIAVLCMGPQIRAGSRVIFDSAPYGWLMILPGFDGLRVPTRFWTLGTLFLAVAAGLGFSQLESRRRSLRVAVAALLCAAVAAEGWLREMPIASAPALWADVEPAGSDRALMELPLGPEWDAAATFRAAHHRRRVINGVSGYDPPHYGLLQIGLNAQDPSVLPALASLGPLDVVVNRTADEDGRWTRYVSSIPGAERTHDDGVRMTYRMPDAVNPAAAIGSAWPIASVATSGADLTNASVAIDGDIKTAWTAAPQAEGAALVVDLGEARGVAGATLALGSNIGAYPRRVAVEASSDGTAWTTVWEGSGLGPAIAGIMRTPREARLTLAFKATTARYVRLRLTASAQASWTVAELGVHRPR